MTNKQFWMKMDQLSDTKKLELSEKAILLTNLLVLAYNDDLDLYISATVMPDGQYHQRFQCAIPGNPNATGSRFLICYTSPRTGKEDPSSYLGCYSTKLRAVLGNLVNKDSIGGLAFNQYRKSEGCIIIPKFMIDERLGKIPPPEGFVDDGGAWLGRLE